MTNSVHACGECDTPLLKKGVSTTCNNCICSRFLKPVKHFKIRPPHDFETSLAKIIEPIINDPYAKWYLTPHDRSFLRGMNISID